MKIKSEINGEGHGSIHIWRQKKFTGENDNRILRYSTWKCKKCFITFNHMYNYIPNIFVAMKACNVPDTCSRADYEAKFLITGLNHDDLYPK